MLALTRQEAETKENDCATAAWIKNAEGCTLEKGEYG